MTTIEPNGIALFPASFDPPTNGHLDLIERSLKVFSTVVVAVAHNVEKRGGTFPVDERIEMLRAVLSGVPRVRVESFSGLTIEYAEKIGARAVIRGLRQMSDFEDEFEMALMNRHLNPNIETFFLTANVDYLYVSSSRLKELTKFGASIDEFVPPIVAERLKAKLA